MNLWKTRFWWIPFHIWRWKSRVRYRLTGDCGNTCDYVRLKTPQGKPVYPFVPEAGCPIHDNYPQQDLL